MQVLVQVTVCWEARTWLGAVATAKLEIWAMRCGSKGPCSWSCIYSCSETTAGLLAGGVTGFRACRACENVMLGCTFAMCDLCARRVQSATRWCVLAMFYRTSVRAFLTPWPSASSSPHMQLLRQEELQAGGRVTKPKEPRGIVLAPTIGGWGRTWHARGRRASSRSHSL